MCRPAVGRKSETFAVACSVVVTDRLRLVSVHGHPEERRQAARDRSAVSHHGREPAHQPGPVRSRLPDPLHEPGAGDDLRRELAEGARRVRGHAGRRAVASGDLGSAVRAHRARHRDARAPELRPRDQPAGRSGHRYASGRSCRWSGRGRRRSNRDHEPRRHRAAADARRAARGRSAQERVHRRAVARAAQPAGGDPGRACTCSSTARQAATRWRRRGPSSTGRSTSWCVWWTICWTSPASPGTRSSSSGSGSMSTSWCARPSRTTAAFLERSGVQVEAGLATRADLRRRGRRADRAGGDQPARERGQVHARRWDGAVSRRGGGGRRGGAARRRQRNRHRTGAAAPVVRAVHAGRSHAGAIGRRARAGPGAGQGAGRAPRRQGEREQRGRPAGAPSSSFASRWPPAAADAVGAAAPGGRGQRRGGGCW